MPRGDPLSLLDRRVALLEVSEVIKGSGWIAAWATYELAQVASREQSSLSYQIPRVEWAIELRFQRLGNPRNQEERWIHPPMNQLRNSRCTHSRIFCEPGYAAKGISLGMFHHIGNP